MLVAVWWGQNLALGPSLPVARCLPPQVSRHSWSTQWNWSWKCFVDMVYNSQFWNAFCHPYFVLLCGGCLYSLDWTTGLDYWIHQYACAIALLPSVFNLSLLSGYCKTRTVTLNCLLLKALLAASVRSLWHYYHERARAGMYYANTSITTFSHAQRVN